MNGTKKCEHKTFNFKNGVYYKNNKITLPNCYSLFRIHSLYNKNLIYLHMKNKNEYVYILSNSELEGKIKIGKTTKHPEVRAEQLTKQTSNVGVFNVEWHAEVDDSSFYEKYLHYVFKKYHYEKEFFLIESGLSIEIAKTAFENIKDLDNKVIQTIEKYKKEIKEAIETLELLAKMEESEKELKDIVAAIKRLENILKTINSNI